MIINWFPFRSLAIIRPINWWPKYTTHTSASYTPANCCWNFKVKAGHIFPKFGLLNQRNDFDILSNSMLKISLSQKSGPDHSAPCGPQWFIQENTSYLLHHFSTVSGPSHGENPTIWVKFWTYPWARPWCPVWPWPPAGPDYFPPGLLCPSPSAPYSILLSSSQNNQTKEDFS